MKDVIDMDWVLHQLEYSFVHADKGDIELDQEFGCNKIIKQALHEEFLQALAPTLPPKALKSFFLKIQDYYYERFTLDDMILQSMALKNGNFILVGDIKNYLTEYNLDENDEILYEECSVVFEEVKNIQITNALGERIYLNKPFDYPINLAYGGFVHNIVQNKHKYTVYIRSEPKNEASKKIIVNNLKKYTLRVDFEYKDIDLILGTKRFGIKNN